MSNVNVVNFKFTGNRILIDVIALVVVVVAALYIAVRLIEINIADFDRFVDSVRNDRRALRKMWEIKRVGIYNDLSRDEVEQIVSNFNLSIDVEEGDGDEDWTIAISGLRKKWDIIRLLNDDHLYSDLSKDRYQVYGKKIERDHPKWRLEGIENVLKYLMKEWSPIALSTFGSRDH